MPNARLHGWKEIAQHLGKTVRTVQRWEKELELPIHRLHVKAGEAVYAEIEELERWLRSREKPLPEETPEDRPGRAPSGRARLAWSVLGVAAMAILAWGVWARRPGNPFRWEVANNSLQVFDRQNRLLWRHVFPGKVVERYYRDGAEGLYLPLVAIDDLDRDGRPEVLIRVVVFESPVRFYCFNHDGKVRFEQPAVSPKQFGDKVYAEPYSARAFHVTSEPDGTKSVWLAQNHQKEFPSVLQRISPSGKVLGEYWSDGHLGPIEEGRLDGRRVIFVGGVNNEHELAASVAVLDYDHPSGSAPSAKDYYRCKDCPAGHPLAHLIFPRMELSYAAASATGVSEISTAADGSSRIEVFQGMGSFPGAGMGAPVLYFLDPSLKVLRAELGSNFAENARLAERLGKLNRKLTKDPATELFPILAWDGEKYVPQWPPKQRASR